GLMFPATLLFPLLAAPVWAWAGPTRTWYAIPLIISISLVYSASRHEGPPLILRRALRLMLTIGGFMLALLLLLLLLSRGT
ncbi:MAG: hypothetical protein ACK5HA_09650, partial [Planctomycetaceae bacterium]